MPDPRFYRREGPRTLADLAAMTGGRLASEADLAVPIADIGELATAGREDIVYVGEKSYLDAWRASACGACITTEALASFGPSGCAVLIVENPRAAFAAVAAAFYPSPPANTSAAAIASDAVIGKNVHLAPGVVIGPSAVVAGGSSIGANSVIGPGVLVGERCVGAGTKIDNLVQIGHNVVIGRNCIIVAQVGISGSCKLGDGVVLGGQVGMADHIEVADGAQVGAQSGLMRNVGRREIVIGSPARPIRQFWREIAALSRLTKPNKGP
jgi:UDP-3-O-[3-hydroxymyristoyl] glucosamine N-acyltransferase